MSTLLYRNGSVIVSIAASDKLSVFSRDNYKVYQKTGYPNEPDRWALLKAGAAGEEYVSAAFSSAAVVRIEAGADDLLYSAGTDALIVERKEYKIQPDPVAVDVTGAVSAAAILGGIVTSSTAAAVAGTIPTGAVMDAALRDLPIGGSVDWSVINTGPNTFTVTQAASGHTLVGAGAVATATSGKFRTRKTAASTFITYRI